MRKTFIARRKGDREYANQRMDRKRDRSTVNIRVRQPSGASVKEERNAQVMCRLPKTE